MKYIILGAGPSGLTFANYLKQHNENDFLVLEYEVEPGGLCRSKEVDGSPFDIGGGHFLDIRNSKVNEFLFKFMPESEWSLFERDSRIQIGDHIITHPIEANLWQLPVNKQVAYLKSIASAGCNLGKEQPQGFVDWIYWKLGSKIADDYMIPYNQKMFGNMLDNLGTYWLEKLPNVSFEETLYSCLERKAYGKQPGHAKFYYPNKFGYGELWRRMGENLGCHLICNKKVVSIDFDSKTIKTEDGESYSAEYIVNTIPWMEFETLIGMPEVLQKSISKLKYTSIQTEYFPDNIDTEAQWIYYPNPGMTYHRILVRHNFCRGSHGYWTETNLDRTVLNESDSPNYRYVNHYAYPLNTIDKPKIMEQLLNWSRGKSVFGLGRWGRHQHYNSDVAVELAIELAEQFLGE